MAAPPRLQPVCATCPSGMGDYVIVEGREYQAACVFCLAALLLHKVLACEGGVLFRRRGDAFEVTEVVA